MNEKELAVFHSFQCFPEFWLQDEDFIKNQRPKHIAEMLIPKVIENIQDEMNDGQEEFHGHNMKDTMDFMIKFEPFYSVNPNWEG